VKRPRTGFGGTYAFNDNLSLSLEYLYGQWDDDEEDVDDSHAATAKVALEF